MRAPIAPADRRLTELFERDNFVLFTGLEASTSLAPDKTDLIPRLLLTRDLAKFGHA